MSDLLLHVREPLEIKFVFLRHGQSCHNLLARKYNRHALFHDAFLSDTGVQRSITTGALLHENFSHFDVIGSSPAMRAMETAMLMTREYAPKNIFTFPYLRECSCGPSDTAKYIADAFPIKPFYEQLKYLVKMYPKQSGVLNDRYSQTETRNEPGNILTFVKWFYENVIPSNTRKLNVLIFCHSNVIREFTGSGVSNNDGFVLETMRNSNTDIALNYRISSHIKFPKNDSKIQDTKCVLKTL